MAVIYKATNKINDKVYIGQTRCNLKKRMYEHHQDAKHHRDKCWRFCHAIRKYGFDNFRWEIIYESNNKDDINEKEEFYINQYDSKNRYNVLNSSHDVYERTLEIRQKISEAQKKRWKNGKYGNCYGPKHSEEYKEKIGLASKKRHKNGEYRKKAVETLSKFWGCTHSDETKRKMAIKTLQRSRDRFGRFIKQEVIK